MLETFSLVRPTTGQVPVILSIPHCGTIFPDELTGGFREEKLRDLDDTDWFVDRLYDFAPAMGITMLSAKYSRWIIDLNRAPDNQPLYSDGRVLTGLCPVTDFLGEPLYKDQRSEIHPEEIQRRKNLYYRPYHEQISQLLDQMLEEFGKVLLWDCHSIRSSVPTIRKGLFPDLILGDADGTSASPGLSEITLRNLEGQGRLVSHNEPFKGGYITRHYGNPSVNVHTLQLEMSKINYMNDEERRYDAYRAEQIRIKLQKNFEELISLLLS